MIQTNNIKNLNKQLQKNYPNLVVSIVSEGFYKCFKTGIFVELSEEDKDKQSWINKELLEVSFLSERKMINTILYLV